MKVGIIQSLHYKYERKSIVYMMYIHFKRNDKYVNTKYIKYIILKTSYLTLKVYFQATSKNMKVVN